MARRRFTVRDLRDTVQKVNGWLESDGSLIRFEAGGRNGYQAVDEYSVDENGKRVGSGCNRNVACGTSRECADYTEAAYSNEYRTLISRKAAALEAENAELKETIACLEDDNYEG